MMSSVSIEGQEKLFSDLDAHMRKLEERSNRAVNSAGLTCQGVAKKNCPVGTPESTGIKNYHGGRLRSSIMVDNSVYLESTIGTNVNYAVFVHEGTVKMIGRPFLRKGFDAGSQQLMSDLGSDA